ncbi:hypothetical protein FRB90_001310, partial [Tulasnella sp. 427]
VRNIRDAALKFGSIDQFEAYAPWSSNPDSSTKNDLAFSGVRLRDCPQEQGRRKSHADKMIITDMMVYALERPKTTTFVLVSGDRGYAYAISTLRNRGYAIKLLAPPRRLHPGLQAVADILDWNGTFGCEMTEDEDEADEDADEEETEGEDEEDEEDDEEDEKDQEKEQVDWEDEEDEEIQYSAAVPEETSIDQNEVSEAAEEMEDERVVELDAETPRATTQADAIEDETAAGIYWYSDGPGEAEGELEAPVESMAAAQEEAPIELEYEPEPQNSFHPTFGSISPTWSPDKPSNSVPLPSLSSPPGVYFSAPTMAPSFTVPLNYLSAAQPIQPQPQPRALAWGVQSPAIQTPSFAQVAASSSGSASRPRSIPPRFTSFIATMRVLESEGNPDPFWSTVWDRLRLRDPNLLQRAGGIKWKEYLLLAEKEGLVTLTQATFKKKGETVSLRI